MLILEWSYLIGIQTLVFEGFYFLHNKHEHFELSRLFQSRYHFLLVNLAVICTCVYLNIRRQLFCIPVSWTLVMLGLFCLAFLMFPFLNKQSKWFWVVSMFSGLGFFIALYIILFGRQEYLIYVGVNSVVILFIWLLIFLLKRFLNFKPVTALWFYAAFILTPYFLFIQLVLMYKSLSTKKQKLTFALSPILILLISLALCLQMNQLFRKIETSQNIETDLKTLAHNPVNSYLIELMLGAHWKYHTEFCSYDGWRPPFHDPVLVISNKVLFPFKHFAEDTRLHYTKLYPVIFPQNPTVFNCRCATKERLFDLEGIKDQTYTQPLYNIYPNPTDLPH